MQLNVLADDNDEFPYIKEITERLNARFRNQEDFEMRMDTFCEEVAQEMNGRYDRAGDVLMFRFGQARSIKDWEKTLSRQDKIGTGGEIHDQSRCT